MTKELIEMTEARFRLKSELQELEWKVLEEIMESKQMDLVSINWRRLHQMMIRQGK